MASVESEIVAWIKAEARTHLFYIILIAVAVISFRVWLSEHDARLQAEATVKQADLNIKTLQQKISDTSTQAVKQVQVVTRIVHEAKTPQQAIAAIPQLTDVPLNARIAPSLPVSEIAVDVTPLMAVLGQCKEDSIQLGACQQDYSYCQQINREDDAKVVALTKKPKFFHRLGNTLKIVAIGVGIGIVLGAHLL